MTRNNFENIYIHFFALFFYNMLRLSARQLLDLGKVKNSTKRTLGIIYYYYVIPNVSGIYVAAQSRKEINTINIDIDRWNRDRDMVAI